MKIPTLALLASFGLVSAQAEPPKLAFRAGGVALRPASAVPAAGVATKLTLSIAPTILIGSAAAPVTPGLYAATPYTMLVEVPPLVDKSMVIGPSTLSQGTARMIEPSITLVPVRR